MSTTTIDQYREAKSHYLKLKGQAKKELLARFNALANELLQVQRELLEDFGEKVTLPAKPTAAKKQSKPAQATTAVAAAAAASAPPNSVAPSQANAAKVASLTKQLDKQKRKLDELKAAGKPLKAVEDRIYELEDEIRLLH